MKELQSLKEVQFFMEQDGLQLIYVLRPGWSVCHGLLPQVEETMKDFPEIKMAVVNAEQVEEIAGYLSIFTVPVLILLMDEKEMIREARIVHMDEFRNKVSKIYNGYYK